MKKKSGTSDIYQLFIDSIVQFKGWNKWNQQIDINLDEWLNCFIFLKYTTRDTKLRWLQYRILHHILTTNRSVAKFNENQSHLCTFCNDHSETIEHLFWDCEKVSIFWANLTQLINKRCQHVHNFRLDKQLILFGQSSCMYTDSVCNLMILMAKFFIYRSKVKNTPLLLNMFITEFYQRYCTEKIITKFYQNFKNEWNPYLCLFRGLMQE